MRNNYRWGVIGLIMLLILINYLDRSAISYAIGPLSEEFDISTAEFGIISSAFAIGYLVFVFLSGPLVDRFGARRVLLVGVLVWSAMSALTPVAGSFAALFLVRVALGAGEGPGLPAATRVASRWLPQRERGMALSLIGGVAVSGSLLISGPLITQLMAQLGWRGMFLTLAGIGVVWVAVCLLLLRDSPHADPRVSQHERELIAAGQIEDEKTSRQHRFEPAKIFGNVNLWMTAIGFFAWGFMFWGFMYWLPGYLSQTYNLSITSVGLFSIVPWAAGVIGAVIGGLVLDQAFIRTEKVRSRFVFMSVALLLAGASLIPIVIAPSLAVAIACISLGVGFGFLTGGAWWVAAIDAAPDQPGAAAGFVDAAFALAGIIAPSVMGFTVAATGSFSSGLAVMSVLAILGSSSMLLFTKERRGAGTPTPETAEPS